MNKIEKLHITLDNICQLNHFVHSYALKTNLVGQEYSTLSFHGKEQDQVKFPWQYKVNRYGYRGENWQFEKTAIAFFGCSITFGIGVETDIALTVKEKLNIPCYNLGQPGASAINILKTASSFLKHYPISTAIIVLPTIERVYCPGYDAHHSQWDYKNYLPNWVTSDIEEIHTAIYKTFTTDASMSYLYDYIKLVELTATLSGTDIIWSSWDSEMMQFLKTVTESKRIIEVGDLQLDKGRDQLHPGPLFVQDWSKHIISALKEYS